jgi:hypothetical protein
MNPQKKATIHQQSEEEQHALNQQQTQAPNAREFASVEEMLREDSLNTPVPPAIAQRLQEAINQLPASPRRPWWRRILGGSP